MIWMWLLEKMRGREDGHRNPWSQHMRAMMAMERQDREQPWLRYRY